MIRYSCVLLFVLFAATLAIDEDLVKYENMENILPKGFDKTAFKMHSGYLDGGEKKKLHYIFFESKNSPRNDPVVFWLGTDLLCSTMYNAFYATAPFGFEQGADLTSKLNDNPWNDFANVLYVDAPAGVGFSRADVEAEYSADDEKTVEQLFSAVKSWHNKFPIFKRNDFYLAGEGYAGIFAPLLAKKIQDFNEDEGDAKKRINLQGMMLGNPFTDWNIDADLLPLENLYYRGIYGTKIRNDYLANCPKNPYGPKCNLTRNTIRQIMEDVNDYDLAGYCNIEPEKTKESEAPTIQRVAEERRALKQGKPIANLHHLNADEKGKTPKCHDLRAIKAMMKNEVYKQALHIDHSSHEWTMCSVKVKYNNDTSEGSLQAYPDLINSRNFRILIFSGDSDGVVPTMSTLTWVRKLQKQMNLMTTSPWTEWYIKRGEEQEAAGFRQIYNKNFIVATVRAGPHSVATNWERRPAVYLMVQSFLEGRDL